MKQNQFASPQHDGSPLHSLTLVFGKMGEQTAQACANDFIIADLF